MVPAPPPALPGLRRPENSACGTGRFRRTQHGWTRRETSSPLEVCTRRAAMSSIWWRKTAGATGGPGDTWNSGVKNAIKVLIGFIPAFLTFALTKEWWFLAYCGAFIWFGITGLRNILQSVLGGGGFRRSPLLRWNDYVSWGRLTDFAALYRIFGAAARLHREIGNPRPDVRRDHDHRPADTLYRHGPGQRSLPLQPQHLPRSAEGRDLGKLLQNHPLHPARRCLQRRHRRRPL